MVPVTKSPATVEPSTAVYREAKPLPNGILDHCTLCFEEQLHSQAFALLSNALTSGTGSSRGGHIPPPQHLGLAATLAVHPQLTTRTTSKDKPIAANDAIRYLRHVNKILGPRNSGLTKAFRFNSQSASASRTKRIRTRHSDNPASGLHDEIEDEKDRPGHVRSLYAGKDAVWNRVEDFWSVLGWALNCSVAHAVRWDRWRLWLELMLDVLEADLACASSVDADGDEESLLAQYLSSVGEGRNNKRRVMRAILADGSPKSLAEFGELWRNETRRPKQPERENGPGAKRRKLDLDTGEFGDYFGDDSNEEESPPPPPAAQQGRHSRAKSSRNCRSAPEDQSDTNSLKADGVGDKTTTSINVPALNLRKRLLALLYNLSISRPTVFLSSQELLDLYTEFLRPLPLSLFQAYALPSTPYLSAQTDLNRMLLRPILAAPAPPARVEILPLTSAGFEKWYAPFAATSTSAGDGAKCAVLIEGLLRGTSLEHDEHVNQDVVEEGVEARRKKVAVRKGKVREEAEAVKALEWSGQRMLGWTDLVS